MKRHAVVAGQFYAGAASKLKEQVEHYIEKEAAREKVLAVVSPHAGLMYSGPVAGAVYSSIRFPETFVILGPNHTGRGANLSVMTSGSWEVPTGTFFVDGDLGKRVVKEVPLMAEDASAHLSEHSIEVQLPFISYFSDAVKIVPIAVLSASLEECRAIGEGIAKAIKETGRDVVIVASSDMSHYVPDDTARKLDTLAINEMLNLNPEGLYTTVAEHRITMCGVIPATIMLYAAKALGAGEAKLVKYATSGETSGDYGHVVGYAGILVK